MFSGIIEELGKVKTVGKIGAVTRLDVLADKVCQDVKIGDSISVNGACLTIVGIKNKILSFDVIPETIRITTLKDLRPWQEVNLERALKAGERIGGHFVTGHVDFIGVIRSKRMREGNLEFQISVPPKFLKYIIRRGSIAVDGISLTMADVRSGAFSVCIIPHTARATTLGKKQTSHKVNVELDILAKRF